jgi:hypothetical protein
MENNSNKIVQSLWIGGDLSLLEILTLYSFIQSGHTFHLYVYDAITTPLPKEVILKDANEILDRKYIFTYKNYNQFGHGKGSVSGFSDIFRYKLLYEKGNWWVDMDVCCLRFLNIEKSYYFRKHHELKAVGNVMKCPPNSALMKDCFKQALQEVNEHNTDWHKPIDILNQNIIAYDLERFIGDGISNRDWWMEIIGFLYSNKKIPDSWYFIHWTNENFRAHNINKNHFKINSTFGKLLKKNGVPLPPFSFWQRCINEITYSKWIKWVKAYI